MSPAAAMTREAAAAAAAAAAAQRDAIQASLLELDASLGRRILAGAALTGQSRQQWARAEAELTALWETFTAYSAVVDRAAGLAAGRGSARLAELAGLLAGPSVQLARPPGEPARRELAAGPAAGVTLAAAVTAMTRAYAAARDVCAAAEAIWAEVADGAAEAGAALEEAARRGGGLADADLAAALGAAREQLAGLRATLNADPLALGPAGQPASPGAAALASLRAQVAHVTARTAELAGLREHGLRRIAAAREHAAAAAAAWQDAADARQRAAARIAGADPAPLPGPDGLDRRVEAVTALHAAGRWTRLAAELTGLERDTAAAARRYAEAEAAAAALLDRRAALRGLLEAYQAKAGALGGAESEQLAVLHARARDALWTAPCDLAAAAAAVTSYQQAVLALEPAGGRP